MEEIDLVIGMLDWNNSVEVQNKGIKLAKEVRNINVFIQPIIKNHDKTYERNVWDNCAFILSERDDQELKPYLHELFQWLMDFNWPGAWRILERLKAFEADEQYISELNRCMMEAKAMDSENWLISLEKLAEAKNISL